MSEAPQDLKDAVLLLIIVNVMIASMAMVVHWIYNISGEIPDSFIACAVFGFLGIIIMVLVAFEKALEEKTPERIWFETKLKEIKSKYKNEEIIRLHRREAYNYSRWKKSTRLLREARK